MMSEEDEVFLEETGETSALVSPAANTEYTQIYGSDDIVITHTSHHSNHSSRSSHHSNRSHSSELQTNKLESISRDRLRDNFEVDPSRNGNNMRKKSKPSLRSESSEDDFYEDVRIDRNGATKPLMYRRQHGQSRPTAKPLTARQKKCRQRCCSFFYMVLIAGGLALFAFVIVFLTKNYANGWLNVSESQTSTAEPQAITERNVVNIVGCPSLSVEDVWVVGIPKFMTESAFRMVDVNSDGVLDVLFGFATGVEGYSVPDIVCDIYFNGLHPCFGGIVALDGATGRELWRHFAPHEIFAVNCNEDMDKDGVKDCLIAGRVASFEAVSGKDGHLLWNFTQDRVSDMNVYTPQFVPDLNGDGVADIVTTHGGDPFGEPGSETRLIGRIYLFSGVDGSVLQWTEVPDGRETYCSPVVYQRSEGVDIVVFGTGGETHPGSLWAILLDDLYKGDIHQAYEIVHNPYKGFMTPPVLLDLNRDEVEDMIIANFNSTVLAVDGYSYQTMWNFSYPLSETYATPAPGFYNDDDVPDFAIHWQYGPGFPVYFHAITTILDGRDGTPILKPYVRSSIGAQASPLSISVEGFGNDLFLHWSSDCVGHEGEGGTFRFINGTNVHEQSRSDFCRLRFKTEGVSRLFAIGRHQKSPGLAIYDSEERLDVEHNSWINSTREAMDYLRKHPEHMKNYLEWKEYVAHNIQKKEESLDGHQGNDVASDPKEHLRQSLAEITGQDAGEDKIPIVNNGAGLPSLPVDLDTNEQLRDYFDTNYPSNSHHLLGSDWPQETEATGLNQQQLQLDTDPANIDEGSYEYLKNLYDALGLNDVDDSRKEGTFAGNSPDVRYRDLDQGQQETEYPRRSRIDQSPWSSRTRRSESSDRKRRHVGPHDEDGLQRLISTGTLAPTLLPPGHPDYHQSIDMIFATYWFYPAKTSTILPEDQDCIDRRMAGQTERFDPNSKYFGMDNDRFEHVVTAECLAESGHQLPEGKTYTSQHTYNPYNVHMGQLTAYRLRIKCTCPQEDLAKVPHSRCSKILPFDQQQWTSYMGSDGTSHWRPLANEGRIAEF